MSITQKAASFTNNLKASFTKKQISTNVTYTYVQDFKDIIGFRQLLEKHLEQYETLKAPNSKYSIADAVDFMSDAVFQGYSRFIIWRSCERMKRTDPSTAAMHQARRYAATRLLFCQMMLRTHFA